MEDTTEQGITKHELAQRYNISLRTVYRTLTVAGLSRSANYYHKSEQHLFKLARSLLEGGFTTTQTEHLIQEYHSQKSVNHE